MMSKEIMVIVQNPLVLGNILPYQAGHSVFWEIVEIWRLLGT